MDEEISLLDFDVPCRCADCKKSCKATGCSCGSGAIEWTTRKNCSHCNGSGNRKIGSDRVFCRLCDGRGYNYQLIRTTL